MGTSPARRAAREKQRAESAVIAKEPSQAIAKEAEQPIAVQDPKNQLGSGETLARDESGLTPIESAKLEGMAIRRGWVELPFPTRVPIKQLKAGIKARGDQTLLEKLTASVLDGLGSKDLRRRGIAERNGIAMESRNLAAEQHADLMNRPVAPPVAQTVDNRQINITLDVAMEALKSVPIEELINLGLD